MAGLDLLVLPDALAVARLEPGAPLPDWAAADRAGGALAAIVRTEDETSVVCRDDAVPAGVRAERGFRAIRVAGVLDFALTGVMAALAVPLAEADVSMLAIATYDTDYVLVRGERLDDAVQALRAAGHRVEGGS